MSGGLRYQTIQLQGGGAPEGGPSARGTAVGAGVKLLHKASKALNGWSVSWRVNREIEKRHGDIRKAMARHEERIGQCNIDTGVLLVVSLAEWEQPDPTGTRAQTFQSLHLGGTGVSARDALRRYRSQARMSAGPPEGWRSKTVFVWVTRERLQ